MEKSFIEIITLPYATIRLKNISIGVVSNQNGDLRLPLRPQFVQDTLVVSYYDNVGKKFIHQASLGTFGGNELALVRVHDALRN